MVRKPLGILILLIACVVGFSPSAKCTTMIEGRIEAIVKPGATLPAPVLKMQVAQIDNTLLQSSSSNLNTGVNTPAYPEYLLGKWGGELKTTWVGQLGRVTAYGKPAEYTLGSQGKVVFEFFKEGQSVKLKENSVYYPMRLISHEQYLRSGSRPEKFTEKLPEMEHRTFRTLDLNNKKLYHPDGSVTEKMIALHSLKTLRRGIVEQDTVVKRYQSGKFDGYKETVLRFTWQRSNLVFAQIGVVDYDVAGRICARSIIQGWLTQSWQTIADEVSTDYRMSWEEIQNFGVVPASK